MGASSPEGYGDYYIWGDPTGEMTSAKFTNNPPSNISGTKYDIAKAKWQGQWRLPTRSEFLELINKCIWSWTTIGTIKGYQVTAENGNSIIIPAASQPSVSIFGESGYYMSGSYEPGYGVMELWIREDGHSLATDGDENKGLSEGYTVRPVME